MPQRARLLIVNLITLAAAFFADQLTKYLILTSPGVRPAGDVLFLHVGISSSLNSGFAFSLPGPHAVIVAIAAIVFGAVLFAWGGELMRSDRRSIALALVIAGGLGNLADRLRVGGVVDFIEVGIKGLSTSSFNLADIFIVLGVLLWLFWAGKKQD